MANDLFLENSEGYTAHLFTVREGKFTFSASISAYLSEEDRAFFALITTGDNEPVRRIDGYAHNYNLHHDRVGSRITVRFTPPEKQSMTASEGPALAYPEQSGITGMPRSRSTGRPAPVVRFAFDTASKMMFRKASGVVSRFL